MKVKNIGFAALSIGCLALSACEVPAPTTPSGAQQTAVPSESDLGTCESTTKRILSTPHNDENLIRAAYGPRLRFLLLRGLHAEPGTDHWINWDYVYETQDDMPKVLSVGPGMAQGNRIVVPVVMQRPYGQPPQTKTWSYEFIDGSWRVSDVRELDGRSLTKLLEGAYE
jgi:hypothetical protein